MAVALLLPAGWRLALLPLVFLAGAALERARHDHGPQPPPLRDTPAAWRATVSESIGWPAVGVGATLIAAAAALVLVRGDNDSRDGAGRVQSTTRPAAPPALPVRRERVNREFRAHGAAFRVSNETDALWAREIRRRPPGRGRKWVTVAVRGRNLNRPRFDPTRLAYRLRDHHGTAYIGAFRGGTGPRSLAQRGTLDRGQSALVQLGYRVPRSARRLTLVFEDHALSGTQIRVSLGQ